MGLCEVMVVGKDDWRSWREKGRMEGEDEIYTDQGRWCEYSRKHSPTWQNVQPHGIHLGIHYKKINTTSKGASWIIMLLRGWWWQ